MNDETVWSWLKSQADPAGEHKNDPRYQEFPEEGKQMIDDMLGAFHAAKTPDEFGKLFFSSNSEEAQ